MPAPTTSSPSPRVLQLASAWKLLRTAALATLVFQLAGSVELVVSGTPANRLGNALFSLGWLTLIGILAYGVSLRTRWALWMFGGYAVLSIPSFILPQVLLRLSTVEVGGMTVKSLTVASTVVDLLSVVASAVFIYGLVRLRQASRT